MISFFLFVLILEQDCSSKNRSTSCESWQDFGVPASTGPHRKRKLASKYIQRQGYIFMNGSQSPGTSRNLTS
jgi:hypothetical protein